MRTPPIVAVATVLVVSLLASDDVAAWSRTEHRIVCEIAWRNLSEKGRAFVGEVLAGDAHFRDTCMWADDVRHTTHRSTATYHYINIAPDATAADPERDCPAHDCAPVAIERFAYRLAQPANGRGARLRRAEALKFLAHFVADLHQPLHAGRAEDRGGNRIAVSWFGESEEDGRPLELHRVWDRLIGRRGGLRAATAPGELMEAFADDPAASETSGDAWSWATESHRLAETVAYAIPADGALGERYFERALPVVRRQLWLAGVRLARLIEESVPEPR